MDSFPWQGTEGRTVMKTTKQTKMTNMKFDHINRQQYVIVFQTRRARRSSTAVSPRNQHRKFITWMPSDKTDLRVFLIFLS